MDGKRDREDLPHEDKESEAKAEESRRKLDEVPAPGTDPLHEGP